MRKIQRLYVVACVASTFTLFAGCQSGNGGGGGGGTGAARGGGSGMGPSSPEYNIPDNPQRDPNQDSNTRGGTQDPGPGSR